MMTEREAKQSEAKLRLLLEQLKRQNAINDYASYVEYVHGGRWLPAKHAVFLCKTVQKFIENKTGHSHDILIIQCPPQHGKSQTITETLPSWYLGKNPYHRVIQGSYNQDTADRFSRRNREKIKEFGKILFGIEISKEMDRNDRFELAKTKGMMMSVGIMGGATSNSAELMIIDDPIKNREEADSEIHREKMWGEWQNSFKTRFQAGTKVILIMTRWHEDDLAGRIIKNESFVTQINLPCEAEENDILGRPVGDALFPEIGKDNTWLADFKQSYMKDAYGGGVRAWNALFQGRPVNQEGNLIKREYWKYYKEVPERFDEVIQSWDCAFKDTEKSDFVVGQVWGRVKADYYLLDMIRQRMDIIKTMEAIESMSEKYPNALAKLVEDKANGSAVIQMLQRKVTGMIPVEPKGGKVARVNAVVPAIESGNVYLPIPGMASWVNEFIEECASFPSGKNDDMVDAMSQALNRLIYNTTDHSPKSVLKGYYTEDELDDMVKAKRITKWEKFLHIKKGWRPHDQVS